jgi:hypothetical protein
MSDKKISPFLEFRDKFFMGGSTSGRLCDLVQNLYNGADNPGLDMGRLMSNADAGCAQLVINLLSWYWKHGENDPEFMKLGRELHDLKEARKVPQPTASDWTLEVVEYPARRVLCVTDLDTRGRRSVTNDAEAVLESLFGSVGIGENDRVIYRDSKGDWDEMKFNRWGDSNFGGFIGLGATTREEALGRIGGWR